MIKQPYTLIIIAIILIAAISLLMSNPNKRIEGFSETRDKTKTKLRSIHRDIRKKTKELYSNLNGSLNRAIRKMKI